MGVVESQLNIITQEVIPAQSAYPYRLTFPPYSPLRSSLSLLYPPLTLPLQGSGLRRGLRISISPMLSIFASVSVSIPPLPSPSLCLPCYLLPSLPSLFTL